MAVATNYNLMWADENSVRGICGAGGGPTFSNSGNFCGQLISCVATYSCCRNFKTNFAVDYFIPGSYYDQSNRDHAVFARVNVEWTF